MKIKMKKTKNTKKKDREPEFFVSTNSSAPSTFVKILAPIL
jgi:hypothetical protein